MKRIITIISVLVMILLTMPVMTAHCTDVEDELYSQVDDILSDSDVGLTIREIGELSLSELSGRILDILRARVRAPVRLLGTLLVVIVFTSFIRSAGGTLIAAADSSIYDMICVMTAVTAVVPQLLDLYQHTLAVIARGGGFIKVFVPAFTVISAACGGLASGSIYNTMVLGASELIVALSDRFLMPLLSTAMVLEVSGSIFHGSAGESLSGLLKRLSTWCISVIMMLFTGFVSLKCTIAGKADGFGVKTARFVISGAVPIVGGAVSDAYSAVRGSFEIVRGAVGYGGIIAIVLIMLPPVLEILVFRCVMWIGTAAAELFSDASAAKLIRGFDSGLAIAQCVLVCYSLMFILCSAIILRTMG